MMAKIKTGDGFAGTLIYALDLKQRNHKEVRFLATEGVDLRFTHGKDGKPNYDIKAMSRDFHLQAKLNPKVSKPVKHIFLSWPEEDLSRLTDQEMMSAAREYMKRMGYVNTQFIAVRHLEKNNPHLHLVINAVNNDGRKISDRTNGSAVVGYARTSPSKGTSPSGSTSRSARRKTSRPKRRGPDTRSRKKP